MVPCECGNIGMIEVASIHMPGHFSIYWCSFCGRLLYVDALGSQRFFIHDTIRSNDARGNFSKDLGIAGPAI